MPPLKLKPFSAGISKEIGIPEIKKAKSGKLMITDKLIQKHGRRNMEEVFLKLTRKNYEF